MKLALLSDIHANIRALDACLGHARQQGAQGFALLGDFVGYGAEPDVCCDIVREHADVTVIGKGSGAAASALAKGWTASDGPECAAARPPAIPSVGRPIAPRRNKWKGGGVWTKSGRRPAT